MFNIEHKPQFVDIEIKPGLFAPADLADLIDAAEALGAVVTHPKLKASRKAAAAAAAIAAQAAEHRNPATAEATQRKAIADYAAGTITVAAFVDQVTRSILVDEVKAVMQRAFAQAEAIQRKASNQAAADLGDEWVNLLRPVVEAHLTKVTAAADAIPANILDPTTSDAENDRVLRTAWLHFGDVLADMYAVHQLADGLRNARAIPINGTTAFAHDFRWLRQDLLRGNTNNPLSFFLLNYRRGALPGIYTQAEVDDAKAANAEPAA